VEILKPKKPNQLNSKEVKI